MSGIVEMFRDVDACAASDAMDRLGLNGVALSLGRLTTDTRLCGRAVTVRMAPAPLVDAHTDKPRRHLATAAVEAAQPGDVIVIANDGRIDVACWGGNLARAASAAQVAGVVIDGAFRDRDECSELNLPVFARAAVPITARGRIIERDWGQPVEIDGVVVTPGDIVIADGSGVVFVPAEHAEDVAATARRIVETEGLMAAELDRGIPVSKVMGTSYEDLLKGDRF